MNKCDSANVRNIGLVGAGGTGKTSLAETILFDTGVTNRLGKVNEGNTVCDYNEDEIERKISINLALAWSEWKGKKINVLDAPGYADFLGELKSVLRVADLGILVVDAVQGLDMATEKVWEYLDEENLPRMIFLNKMDKERANFTAFYENLRREFGPAVLSFQLPVGQEAGFKGLVDIIKEKAYIYQDGQEKEETVPAEMQEAVKKAREKLLEGIASTDDVLIEKYLGGEELTAEEIQSGIKKGISTNKIVPLVLGSALNNIGTKRFLDFIADWGPSPLEMTENPKVRISPSGPFSALVFKTVSEPRLGEMSFFKIYSGKISSGKEVYNPTRRTSERLTQLFLLQGKTRQEVGELNTGDIGVALKLKETSTGDTLGEPGQEVKLEPVSFPLPVMDMAVNTKEKQEVEKMAGALASLTREDPTFKFRIDTETKESIVSGIGSLQLEVMVSRVKKRYGIEMELHRPRVPYKETILGRAEVQGKYKRQSGGRGQYGDAWIKLEPLERGKGFEFVDKIFGGVIPKNYIPAVEKGVREAMVQGVIAGYPVVDIRVTLSDGSYHEVDSSDMAFKIAGAMALRKGIQEARPVMLEPIMNVEVVVTEDFMGAVMGDLNSRRGRVMGMEKEKKKYQKIKAQVPLGEMFQYGSDLRSLTRGAGTYKMEFSHYEELPAHLSQPLIEKYLKDREEGR